MKTPKGGENTGKGIGTRPVANPDQRSTVQEFQVEDIDAGRRLDQFLTFHLHDVSRSWVQQLIDHEQIEISTPRTTIRAVKASHKLNAGEIVIVRGEVERPPLRARAEAIPLDVLYEDSYLAVINKPAGMMVHAGAGATDSARNQGTLVNALLHHMATLSTTGGVLRPGIVHRLDKQTSGLIIIAKCDQTHSKLTKMFVERSIHKSYIALVHGAVQLDHGTLNAPISRDTQRRTRMTTRLRDGRAAVSHYRVMERFQSDYGKFSLLEVEIETGRTHQIRVHLSSIGHPVVGDTLYGAPRSILPQFKTDQTRRTRNMQSSRQAITLDRNFLHAVRLRFIHPELNKELALTAPLPADLLDWLEHLKAHDSPLSKANPEGER